jgi:16S rRNA (guanine527-N7)-methyltransferase
LSNFAKSGAEAISIQWRIPQWFPDLPEEIQIQFKKYHDELIRFNKTVNLIGVKTIPVADALHFADSILAWRIIKKDLTAAEIYDLGSGNGFPGLVMAILAPEIKFHLVDVDQRKAEFLKHMISHLDLQNVDVMIRQIETLPDHSIQAAVSRGYAPLAKAVIATRRLFPKEGAFYHLKGEEWATEISDIPAQVCSYWQPSLLGEYRLPVGEVKFAVVKTTKTQA